MPGTIPVICGPTAGGKSALAMEYAAFMHSHGRRCEIITADAFQVYRGMNIGTAKPTRTERERVVHHLIDITDPQEQFTASQWLAHAHAALVDCERRDVHAVVVGGTHLYVRLLLEGMFVGPGADARLRDALHALPRAQLREELERVDPDAAARIHPNDVRRTVRAIEVFRLSGRRISELQRQWNSDEAGQTVGQSPFLLVVLDWPTEAINRRINARVVQMIRDGLADEAQALWSARALGPTAREALGYKQLIAHFEGRCSLDDAIEKIKIETRRFAKNQRTWLRHLRTTPGTLILTPPNGGGILQPNLRQWAMDVRARVDRSFSELPRPGNS